jgi:branched-chain amino acid transport system permease protein
LGAVAYEEFMSKVDRAVRSLRGALIPLSPAIALVAVQLVFFGLPAGAWIRAVVIGLLTALLAVGMALVYRANRVLNFSQADLGFVPATLSVGRIALSLWFRSRTSRIVGAGCDC